MKPAPYAGIVAALRVLLVEVCVLKRSSHSPVLWFLRYHIAAALQLIERAEVSPPGAMVFRTMARPVELQGDQGYMWETGLIAWPPVSAEKRPHSFARSPQMASSEQNVEV